MKKILLIFILFISFLFLGCTNISTNNQDLNQNEDSNISDDKQDINQNNELVDITENKDNQEEDLKENNDTDQNEDPKDNNTDQTENPDDNQEEDPYSNIKVGENDYVLMDYKYNSLIEFKEFIRRFKTSDLTIVTFDLDDCETFGKKEYIFHAIAINQDIFACGDENLDNVEMYYIYNIYSMDSFLGQKEDGIYFKISCIMGYDVKIDSFDDEDVEFELKLSNENTRAYVLLINDNPCLDIKIEFESEFDEDYCNCILDELKNNIILLN